MAFAVEPGHLHASGQRTNAVQMRVVPHMQHFVRLHPGGAGGGFKNTHIGLGHTGVPGTHRGMKVLADAHAVHVGIAIGQRHHRQPRTPEGQRGQGVVKQIDPLALGKEHFKGRFGQLARFARRLQQGADGFAAQKGQVVRPVGMAGVDVGAYRLLDVGL